MLHKAADSEVKKPTKKFVFSRMLMQRAVRHSNCLKSFPPIGDRKKPKSFSKMLKVPSANCPAP